MDHNKNGLIFAVGFPLSVILISLFLAIASYLCTPNNNNNNPISHDQNTTTFPQNTDQNFFAIELDGGGLDEVSLHSFPKLLYSQYNLKKSSSASAAFCCSICLADYKETDMLQLLPGCGHLFHLKDATQSAMCPAANLAMVNMTSGGATQPAMCPANNAMCPAANRATKSTPSILGVTLPISATENCGVEYAHNPEDPIRPPLVAVPEYKATKYVHKSPQNMATSLAILNRKKSSGLGKIHAALACYGTQRASQVRYDSLHQDQRAPQD